MSVFRQSILLGLACTAAAAKATTSTPTEDASANYLVIGGGGNNETNATRRLQNEDVYYAPLRTFLIDRDLLSLHYDNAPDRDDAHSAAMDRTILQDKFGCGSAKNAYWPVQGTYGLNKEKFVPGSNKVMDDVWNGCGGYVDADKNWNQAVEVTAAKWREVIRHGGRIFVKEGGQSDFTADVMKKMADIYTRKLYRKPKKFFIVQHSDWNEDHTTPYQLRWVKEHAMYTRIDDANEYLKRTRPNFVAEWNRRAIAHPKYGKFWKTAIDFYNTKTIVDFSDTGELMHILKFPPYTAEQLLEMYF